MNKLIIIFISVLCISSAFGYVSHVWYHNVKSGVNNIYVSVSNEGGSTIRRAEAELYVPELDVYSKSSSANIRRQKLHTFVMQVDVPDTKPDYYPALVKVRDKDGNLESKGTWIYIS